LLPPKVPEDYSRFGGTCRRVQAAHQAEFGQIKLIDKDIDCPDRIVLTQIVI
jgi:hypothetical protein